MRSLLELFPEEFRIDILDIGAAYHERPAYQGLVEAKRARLTGFEPNAQECEKLNRSYGEPHRFHPFFIGDGQPATFHETNWSFTGSLLEPNTPLLEKFNHLAEVTTPVAQHPVATRRLDDIPEIDNVDFIKIDVQGSELSIFRNALRALAGTVVVQTEVCFVELYKGQPMFGALDDFMRGQGFQFHTFTNLGGRAFKPVILRGNVQEAVRQVLWADAFYVRDWMRLEALDNAKLRNYAILVHDMLGSVDLAYVVLAELDRRNGSNLAPAYLSLLAKS